MTDYLVTIILQLSSDQFMQCNKLYCYFVCYFFTLLYVKAINIQASCLDLGLHGHLHNYYWFKHIISFKTQIKWLGMANFRH